MKRLLVLTLALALTIGCTKEVPVGYNGMIMKPGGLTGEILSVGKHTAWGRDKMILWEKAEIAKTEKLKILCADDLNFSFDLKLRAMLSAQNSTAITYILDKMGSAIIWDGSTGILKFDTVYNTYVRDPAREVARGIVSKYKTTDISKNRAVIKTDVSKAVLLAVKDTPVEITYLGTSNFDYPEVITRSMEKRSSREIALQEEKAIQAMELMRMDNRKALAEKEIVVREKEAEAEGIYIQILGKSLNEPYLRLRAIERDVVLYKNVKAGDKVIVTNGNTVQPMIDTRGQSEFEPKG
jgi:hypothetical protein